MIQLNSTSGGCSVLRRLRSLPFGERGRCIGGGSAMINVVAIVFASLLFTSTTAFAQSVQKDSLPYQKYRALPAFNLLMQDSTTIFNTYNIPEGKPVLLVFFSPDCDHCEMTIKEILGKMDSLKGVQFYMFTPMDLALLRPFAKKLSLASYKNITMGKDYQYFFPAFYGAQYVPYLVVYDRKKKFVKMWEGGAKIPELMAVLRSL
jgi:thiol-disulfide isomerase/thioredoxin